MVDVLSKEQRHRCMSHIRYRNTKPEILVRKYLFAHGFRYRKNVKTLPGTPDIVLPKYKTVVFVNGCFWHGHIGCKYAHLPETNAEFWKQKIEANQERDIQEQCQLRESGWNVIQIWQCELKPKNRIQTLQRLANTLNMFNKKGNNKKET